MVPKNKLAKLALLAFLAIADAVPAKPPVKEAGTDCFPLVDGSTYRYKGTFNAKVFDKNLVLKTQVNDKVTGCYFVDLEEKDKEGTITGSNCFGLGIYFFEGATLYTVEAFWVREAKVFAPAKKQKLLTFPLKKGDKSEVKAGTETLTLEVLGDESVTVPAGKFDCIKVSVKEIWPMKQYQGYVWLHPGIGIVRRQFSTGRIEELVSYNIPKK